MAGVRVTANRGAVLDLPTGDETLRLSTIRYVAIISITEQNPDFPAGRHAVRIIS